MKKPELLFLKPVCTHNIWGGNRLRTEYGYEVTGDDIGECWGISAYPGKEGVITNGAFSGKTLSYVWKHNPELFGNIPLEQFPLLVKIIDAREDLSIQVHPDDHYACLHENKAWGKTECWYILDCPKQASLVIGHHAKSRKELEEMIEQKRWGELIREIPVKKGDFIQIPPGTVHAIKGDMLILETQQSSDITYRVYDYDRLSDGRPRELHLAQSKEVITVPALDITECVINTENAVGNQLRSLYRCKYYEVFSLEVSGVAQIEQRYPFLNVSVVEGEGKIDEISIKKGSHFIIPNHYGEVYLTGNMKMILSTVGSFFALQ